MVNNYIYIRHHESYDKYNVVKLGKTTDLYMRDCIYSTGEVERGVYIKVVKIPNITSKQLTCIENLLKYDFSKYNIRYNAGTEFFTEEIINLLETTLKKYGINYEVLDPSEVYRKIRLQRVKDMFRNILVSKLKGYLRNNRNTFLRPRRDQHEIIKSSLEYFKTENKGILELTCGLGKTLISLWIAESLFAKKILIGVPNCKISQQWKETIRQINKSIPVKIIDGKIKTKQITEFIKDRESYAIIVTYSSSHKLRDTEENDETENDFSLLKNVEFDFKILDEMHHITQLRKETNKKTDRANVNILSVPSKKQLGLTATQKIIENLFDKEDVISNDNQEIFGRVIERRSLSWAIKRDLVCDYNIYLIGVDDKVDNIKELIDTIEDYDERKYFLSAYIAIKAIQLGLTNHQLIYCNNRDNCNEIIKYINVLKDEGIVENVGNIYYSPYTSKQTERERENILSEFKASTKGILVCVYCLGEGWDLPLLDGVVFAENMYSNIRILQSALRPNRKNPKRPDKKFSIILPELYKDENWLESQNFKQVKNIITRMSLEDESIYEKLKVVNIERVDREQTGTSQSLESSNTKIVEINDTFVRDLIPKLIDKQTMKDLSYEKLKKQVQEKGITTIEEYQTLAHQKGLPEDPTKYPQFKSWVDFFGIRDKYYTKEEFQQKIKEYVRNSEELQKELKRMNYESICKFLYDDDNKFPSVDLIWIDIYGYKSLKDIFNEIAYKRYRK